MASVKNLGGHKDKQTLLLRQPGLHGTNSHEGHTTSSVTVSWSSKYSGKEGRD